MDFMLMHFAMIILISQIFSIIHWHLLPSIAVGFPRAAEALAEAQTDGNRRQLMATDAGIQKIN